MSQIKKKYFIIKRTDQLEESQKISSIYNLSKLKKINKFIEKSDFRKGNEIILHSIKKMILSTNLYSKWKVNATYYLLFLIHFCFIISATFSFMKEKEIIIKEKKKISQFILRLFILHSLLIPFWFLFNNGISKTSKKIQKIIFNLGKYILNYDSLNNIFFNFELLEDLSLKVIKKEKYEIKNEENIFYYAIVVNVDYFETEDILYKSLIPNSDLSIIINLYNFINLELNNRFDFFFKKLLIPSFITLISFYYLSKDTSYHSYKCLLITFILLLLVFILEIDYNKISLKKFNDYIDNFNNDYYNSGKFIFRFKTLLIIFSLSSKGKMYSLEILKNKINKILNS